MLRVQRHQCASCIYRSDSPLDLQRLENDIADPRMAGHFKGYRICHHSGSAVCRGFWTRHKDDFDAGQIAQRLGIVELVDDDIIGSRYRKKHTMTPTTSVATDKQITVPTVHINGTGANDLLSQYEHAFSAVTDAIRAVTEAAPHGRDYYVHGPDAYQAARNEHLDRVRRLQTVAEELIALHASVLKQDIERKRR